MFLLSVCASHMLLSFSCALGPSYIAVESGFREMLFSHEKVASSAGWFWKRGREVFEEFLKNFQALDKSYQIVVQVNHQPSIIKWIRN